MTPLRVAVVGGGIGGLTAALALLRRGLDVRLYEQAPAFTEVGAGVGLTPNGHRLLNRLGLRLGHCGTPLLDGLFCQADGTTITKLTVGEDAANPTIGLHRADLIAALSAELPGDVVHTGYRCVGVTEHDHHITAHFAHGPSVAADVIIAADGIHSSLQRFVTTPTPPVFSGSVAYRGVISSERVPQWPRNATRNWLGAHKHFLVYPIRAGHLLNYVAFVPAGDHSRDSTCVLGVRSRESRHAPAARPHESWSAPGNPSTLRREFAGWDPLVSAVLAQVDTTFRWGLYDRTPLSHWTSGHLTLLGDAAHPMLPHLGQGANQSIEDAYTLALLLADATRADIPAALAFYESLRRPRTTRVQHHSRVAGALYDATDPVSTRNTQLRNHSDTLSWLHNYDAEAEALAALEVPRALRHVPAPHRPSRRRFGQ
ncbi:FAD-dependent monooxygenase [Kibdelosporangium philippinense]|uniref:FAD-dependent monooxygenase n=1 Tax=Kibdelosporangium philippinense TaxID=211113 RepID=A0ABS8Z5T8_9PSEU|nr:FAD-dependent oxidoreductase [Kibdelosporangium philippinense]MCE7001938.1 FAD-dependent monooxygenase [Kibdelosporangium philippinense]